MERKVDENEIRRRNGPGMGFRLGHKTRKTSEKLHSTRILR
jgi:hypothetical protein